MLIVDEALAGGEVILCFFGGSALFFSCLATTVVGVGVGVYDIDMIVLCGSSVALLMKDEACDDDHVVVFLLLFSFL